MWFEIDLGKLQIVSGLRLNIEASPRDYPRGYIVRLSEDQLHWQEVARTEHNDRPLNITFSPRPARYVRIEQTGRSDHWWWSIHGIKIER
jgi:hypothetical protein